MVFNCHSSPLHLNMFHVKQIAKFLVDFVARLAYLPPYQL